MESALTMIAASGLPSNLWAEAVLHSVWIKNHVPTRTLDEDETLYEKGTRNKPDLSQIYEWGLTVWIKKLETNKLEEKAEKGHFVGFDKDSKGYCVYWPSKKKVSIECDIYFNKDELLPPNNIQIEGEWDVPINLDTDETSSKPKTTQKHPRTIDKSLTYTTTNVDKPNIIKNTTENQTRTSNIEPEPTIPTTPLPNYKL